MSSKRYAQVDKEYCVSCGTCIKACPLQAISVPDGISAVVELGRCIGCGLCTTKCKFDAIHLKKVRDWHAGSYETMPIKVAEGVVKRAGSIVKKAVLK